MLDLNYTQYILNLQEVIVKKVITAKESTVIDIEMPQKTHTALFMLRRMLKECMYLIMNRAGMMLL